MRRISSILSNTYRYLIREFWTFNLNVFDNDSEDEDSEIESALFSQDTFVDHFDKSDTQILKGETIKEEKAKRKPQTLDEFFQGGTLIYQGYVNDHKNADNAWIETSVYHFHDEDGNIFKNVTLNSGEGSLNLKWVDIDNDLNLYEGHINFMKNAIKNLENTELFKRDSNENIFNESKTISDGSAFIFD